MDQKKDDWVSVGIEEMIFEGRRSALEKLEQVAREYCFGGIARPVPIGWTKPWTDKWKRINGEN